MYDVETGLYYLQSRYYDPEIGRFINSDVYANTGQGFVGNNMFAYCLNNPINYIDDCGTVPSPIPSLRDFYYMHKAVQYDVSEQYGYAIEVFVSGPKGSGYLDLYDAELNQYYEVKSDSQVNISIAKSQMEKYDAAKVYDWRFLFYSIPSSLERGNNNIMGTVSYSYWDITYWLSGNGLILYAYTANYSRYMEHYALTVGLMYAATKGLAAGAAGGHIQEGRQYYALH